MSSSSVDDVVSQKHLDEKQAEAKHDTFLAEVDTSGIDEKKLIRKMDFTLIPWLSFLFLLSFLDRTSIGNARLYKLEKDIHITDTQYFLCLTIFFFTYAGCEVPSNIFLRRLRPSIWLSFLMLMWGIMMTVQGLVHNYSGLLAMRALLGIFEAGLFPGVTFYLSCWYCRSELGLRIAIFFSAATASGAFGGLLAAAISNLDGKGGKPAWAWIFIIEGLITIVAGAFSFFIIQDFPDTAKFLTTEERAFVVRRLQVDDQFSAAGEKLKVQYIWAAVFDWKIWTGMAIYAGCDAPLYAFSLFLPTIIAELEFKATPANLLTVPVYVVACAFTVGVGFWADRVGNRGTFHLIFFTVALIGYVILMISRKAALSYFAVYVAAVGIYPCISNTVTWTANNVEGSYKRSVSMAMVIAFGNINGAVASNVYRAKDKPWYRLGHGIVVMYILIGIISSLTLKLGLKRENVKRERGERDEIIRGVNYDESVQHTPEKRGFFYRGIKDVYDSIDEVKREKGDKWSGFRYVT